MSIYRGAGGAGDAVADSSSEALLVRELAIEVQADADAAAASATDAANSASAAATSETNASNSASAASTSATNAASSASSASSSASSASTSATNAATSATAAQTAETNAETAETNAETAATNAASSASTASTQATNAASSASAASTSATSASSSASAASTSATNAASSASSASTSASAASTSAANALTSANNAEASENLAANYASNSAVSASDSLGYSEDAAISATAAATSATNASSSASAASTSASSASTSATNAATSATSAGSSATSAAASAAAAAASYDSFDDRYLGVKTAAPTVDNDSNALVTGALYYNDGTVTPADKGMWVYDGSTWIAASAASTAILTVFKYTATGGQTTFTGADDNSLTLTYTAGSAIITVNGAVMEVGTDVTATTGTSIVLAQAALAGDEVNIYAFATFNVANVLSNTSPSVLSGNLNFATTGQRITGDFSNATLANRVMFQTSTVSANTRIGILPSATSSGTSGPVLFSTNDPNNSSVFDIRVTDTLHASLQSGITGTGTYLPLTMYTGGSERLRIDTSGNVGVGTSSPYSVSNYTGLSLNGTNGSTFSLFTNGTRSFTAYSTSGAVVLGSVTSVPLVFNTADTERMRINADGLVGIGGTPVTGYGKLQVKNGYIFINEDGANTHELYLRSFWAGVAPAIQVTTNDPLAFLTNNTERMRIDASGLIQINTTSSSVTGLTAAYLTVNQNNNATHALNINNLAQNYSAIGIRKYDTSGTSYPMYIVNSAGTNVGSISMTNSAVAFNTSSDYRLKENIEPMTGALATVAQLKPVTYDWKAGGSSQGFIAHELAEVCPEAVTGEKDAVDAEGNPRYQGIDTSFLVATLTKAIQEQQEMIKQLQVEVAALKGTV